MNRKSQIPIVLLLIVALVLTGVTRQFAADHRGTQRTETASGNAAQLSRMNSFALTLLLGGLRGPLVMILWTSSESQKSEKNLEDFDTKVEWIRLLQPEFDSVHIFQMWNKAYNVSVQMASLANKYVTIIDAIKYGTDVDSERPDDINILYQIGSIYGDKLGDSAEKVYYTRRVRHDSLPHPVSQRTGGRRFELDPVLDSQGLVLQDRLIPSGVHIAEPNSPDVYDGSDLEFLKKFEPYPYGIPPFGFAYNYRKRSQLLQRAGGQKHAQLSELVIDSRPALDLRKWGESEWEHGRRLEDAALGGGVPTERLDMELPTADVVPDVAIGDEQRASLNEALYSYNFAERLWAAADLEYIEHLKRYKNNLSIYESHRAEVKAQMRLCKGDAEYLAAVLNQGDRAQHLAAAREAYRQAIVHYSFLILRYYIPQAISDGTYPKNISRENFTAQLQANADQIPPEVILPIVNASVQQMRESGYQNMMDEIHEYLTYMARADRRLVHLPAPATAPNAAPGAAPGAAGDNHP